VLVKLVLAFDPPGRKHGTKRVAAGFALILASMVILFRVPAKYFAATTFLSMACMLAVSYEMGLSWTARPRPKAVLAGVASACVLYLVFLLGNAGIANLHPLGIGSSNEASVYSLIASRSNPLYLQAAMLVFDSAGYESFFRGVLQARLNPRLGIGSAPLVAAVDSFIHVITLNPLWVATTFVADLTWGLTYYYSKGLWASFTSHLLWDFAIFVLFPIR
jgi:membrane protease YdiL (CAAX protease family)